MDRMRPRQARLCANSVYVSRKNAGGSRRRKGLQTNDPVARSLDPVAPVDSDREHGHSLDRTRAAERARVNWTKPLYQVDSVHRSGFRFFGVAGDQRIAVERLIDCGEPVCGLRFECRDQRDARRQPRFEVLACRAFRQLDVAHAALLEENRHGDVDQHRAVAKVSLVTFKRSSGVCEGDR